MNYRELIQLSLEQFRRALVTERWVAAETELVNFFEKRGLLPVLLNSKPGFDIARVCRESHVRNPNHPSGTPRGSTTYRRKADLVIWPANRLTTYGDSFTDPVHAPDVLMEFKAYVGDRRKLDGLKRGFAEDLEKVRLAREQSPGLLGCAVWIDVPSGRVDPHFFPAE